MKTIFLSSVFALLFAGFCSAQSNVLKTSDPLTWQKLSEIDLTFDGRGAEIPLYEKEKFASLHFRLLNAQLELQTAEITFDNGEKQSVVLNQRLYAQQHSGIIDLSGDRRILKSVAFTFKPIPKTDDRRATIQLWASKASPQEKKILTSNNSRAGAKTTVRKKIKKR